MTDYITNCGEWVQLSCCPFRGKIHVCERNLRYQTGMSSHSVIVRAKVWSEESLSAWSSRLRYQKGHGLLRLKWNSNYISIFRLVISQIWEEHQHQSCTFQTWATIDHTCCWPWFLQQLIYHNKIRIKVMNKKRWVVLQCCIRTTYQQSWTWVKCKASIFTWRHYKKQDLISQWCHTSIKKVQRRACIEDDRIRMRFWSF